MVNGMWWIFLACTGTKSEPVVEGGPTREDAVVLIPPSLSITSPSRGEFAVYNDLAISGSTEEGSAAISRLLINQSEVALINGDFAYSQEASAGINVLNFRLEAEDGERVVDSLGIYKGPFHPIDEPVEAGIRLQIGQELLDDNDPDLDDLAAIAENMLNSLDLESMFVGETYDVSGFDVIPNGFSHGGIDLQIQTGQTLMVYVEVADLDLDFTVDTWLDLDGEVTAESAVLSIQLDFTVEDGLVQVLPVGTTAEFTSMDVEIEYIPGLAENLIIDWAQDNIEEMLAEEAESLIIELATEYLNSFVIDSELFAGVNLLASVAELDVGEEGLRIVADGTFYGPIVKELSSQIGSAKMAEEPPDWPLSTSKPFAAAVSGDLANQLMFAAWATGFFDNIEMDGFLIQGLAGDALPPPIGPVDMLRLNLALPPSLHVPTVDGMTADLGIGEWQMLFTREDGEEIDFRVNLKAGVYAYFDEGRIRLTPDNRPSKIELGVATITAPENLDKGDVSALGRLMVPSLLGSVNNYLPSIELPSIPLGGLYEGLEGEELVITTAEISVTNQAWALIEADLE